MPAPGVARSGSSSGTLPPPLQKKENKQQTNKNKKQKKTRQQKIEQKQTNQWNSQAVTILKLDPHRYEHYWTRSWNNTWEQFSGPYRIWTHNLCNTGAVLYQLSWQANWELVIMLGPNKPSKWWIMIVDIWKSYMCTAVKKRIWNFHIFTIIIHHLDGLFGPNIMTSSQLAC